MDYREKHDYKYCSYIIPTIREDSSFINIYYKNMKIQWVLQEFNNKEASNIANLILKYTKCTTYNPIYRTFLCKNQADLKIIYKYLYSRYHKHLETCNFPSINIIEESLLNFCSDTNVWIDFK